MSPGDGMDLAIIPFVRKILEPMIIPMTIMVESENPVSFPD